MGRSIRDEGGGGRLWRQAQVVPAYKHTHTLTALRVGRIGKGRCGPVRIALPSIRGCNNNCTKVVHQASCTAALCAWQSTRSLQLASLTTRILLDGHELEVLLQRSKRLRFCPWCPATSGDDALTVEAVVTRSCSDSRADSCRIPTDTAQPPKGHILRWLHPSPHRVRLAVLLCVGILCLLRGRIALEFGLVSLSFHRFLRLSCAGLTVFLGPGCCWTCSAFSV